MERTLHRSWVEMTASRDESFTRRHTDDAVHRVPQRVLPLLVGTKGRYRIGFGADPPGCWHFRPVD